MRTRIETRVVPSSQAGYGPYRWVAQYKDYGTWFDIGDPEDTESAARAKAEDWGRMGAS